MSLDHPDAAAAIHGVLVAIADGHRARDARAIAAHYAADAVIADLAPPLCRTRFDAEAAQAWLDGWDGPVKLTRRDLRIEATGDLGLAHGLLHTHTRTRTGEEAAWWCRHTAAFVRTAAGWRIVHEHSSVPFHMDGSDRAAIDLQP